MKLFIFLALFASASCFLITRSHVEDDDVSSEEDDDDLPIRDTDLETTLANMERSIRILDSKVDEHTKRSVDLQLVKIFRDVRAYFYETINANEEAERIEEQLEEVAKIRHRRHLGDGAKPRNEFGGNSRIGQGAELNHHGGHGIGHGVDAGHRAVGHGIGQGVDAGAHHGKHHKDHSYDPYHGKHH